MNRAFSIGRSNDDLLIVGRPLKVFCAIPLRDEWRGIDRSLVRWFGSLAKSAHRIVVYYGEPAEPVELARNRIATTFLSTDCDALLMIDQDQRPQASAALLLESLADITSGATLLARNLKIGSAVRRGLAVPASRLDTTGHLASITPSLSGLQEVDAVGFGAVLIKRRVIEDRRLWLAPDFVDPFSGQAQTIAGEADEPLPVFRTIRKPNGKTLYGEDYDFCLRAKALGYSVAVQMNARFGHVKASDLLVIAGMGDEENGQPSGYVMCEATEDLGG